jgi:hypothetical protein
MKKYFYILAALSVVPNLSLAQAGNFDAEVDQELDQMYSNKQVESAASPASARGGIAGTAAQGSQPIYILNQATPSAAASTLVQTQTAQVQKQPVTLIESTPLVESKAEQMRKSRQDAEVQTEQKIVEKLESSRLDDEKKRADVLFGNKFDQIQGNATQIKAENSNVSVNTQQQAVQTPVVVQAPVITPVEPKENLRDVVREELKSAMKVETPIEVLPAEVKYFAAIAGIGDYPDVRNVRGNYALGAAFGTKYDQLIVEGSFLLSNYTVEKVDCCSNPYFPTLVDTNQYQAAVAAKYQLMSSMVRPVVGGLVAYSYRRYNWANVVNSYPYSNYGTTSDSHAVDLGVTAGVDLELSKKFALGFEYRYMFNLSSRVNNQSIVTGPQYGTPIEKLSYYTMALAAKVNF